MACRGEISLRFEDVTQDGRLRLEPLTASLNVVWRDELSRHPLSPKFREEGIIPITTRFLVESRPGPFAFENPVEVEGNWDVARTVDANGATNRFLMLMRTQLFAPLGRTNLPPPDDAGTRASVGSVLAEHVFTRPFAEPNERRVTDLGEAGRDAKVIDWAEPKALLDGPVVVDEVPVVFGLTHTDSNQHVNALTYPRLFEEAVLRRLGRGDLLARRLDVRYRKPSFAGDRLSLALNVSERDGRVSASGVFFEPGTEPTAGRVFLHLTLH
jgi:hypothetical protein